MRAGETAKAGKSTPCPPKLVSEASDQTYAQVNELRYLGGLANGDGELTDEVTHRELVDQQSAPRRLNKSPTPED